jgi:hypothetical protein
MKWEAMKFWLNAGDTKWSDNRILFAIGCIKADLFGSSATTSSTGAERQVTN